MMKIISIATPILLFSQSILAVHDVESWNARRRLEDEMVCTLNHDAAQSNPNKEILVKVSGSTMGFFNVTIYKNQPPWSDAGDVTHPGWCVDWERPITHKDYSMDIYSLVDNDLPDGSVAGGVYDKRFSAVDKRHHRAALAYMINQFYVGKPWVPTPSCNLSGLTITWKEIQLAVWKIIDDQDTTQQTSVTGVECIAQYVADDALKNGLSYVPDCYNSGELVPLAYVADVEANDIQTKKGVKEVAGQIRNQVIISETPIHEIEGMCNCVKKTLPPTPPTNPPTNIPTVAPTKLPTVAPTKLPTVAPTKAPAVPPTSPPAPDQPPVGDRNGPPTYVKGDPHFKTFGGEMFDFHGECDLVLIQNPEFSSGLGMDVHIRTKIEDFWSSVQSAVIRLGEETMEIQADPDSDEWLWVNGHAISPFLETGKWYQTEIAGFLLRYKQSSASVREANIYFKQHAHRVVFKTFKSFVRIDVDWENNPENYVGSVGLLGSFNQSGLRVGRDGATPIIDANEFGQEWQVNESDPRLFHSYEGAVVGGRCIMPPVYSPEKLTMINRRLRASKMTVEDAEKACDHLHDDEEMKACIFDVIATQDLSMASAW